VRDLARVDEATLVAHVGPALAATLAAYATGEDRREVDSHRRAKSLGHEQTFAVSLRGAGEAAPRLREQAAVVARALREHHQVARTLTVIVRFDDLSQLSRAQTLPFGVDDEDAIAAIGAALLETVDLAAPVRLLGLHASGLRANDDNAMQLAFAIETDAGDPRERALNLGRAHQVGREALRDAVDEVRRRFGRTAVASASELSEEGVEVATQRGRAMFGPDATSGR
ncbi:MAG: hypothetical protein ACRDV0_05265, partial [Acidimicrobiales bacterium]